MEMKVKSALIRKYRSERFWSQEQLASASGLSLRTIQRLEARGSASIETIKSLAAVFEVKPETLYWRDGKYEVYKHKQWGISLLLVMPVLIAAVLLINHFVAPIPPLAVGVIFGILTVVSLLFSSMTIEVNESEITWFFGPGAFKNTLPLEEVAECKKVRNPFWMGYGIHSFGTGWIYNVSGLWGIEIERKDGTLLRLGSDQPNYLLQAIVDAKDNVIS